MMCDVGAVRDEHGYLTNRRLGGGCGGRMVLLVVFGSGMVFLSFLACVGAVVGVGLSWSWSVLLLL